MTSLEKLENSWKIYNDIQFQIRYADRKVQILLAICLAVITVLLPYLSDLFETLSLLKIIVLICAVVSGVSFFSQVFLSLFARGTKVKVQKATPVTFFGHIAQYDSAEKYSSMSRSLSHDEVLEDLNIQIYQISHIIMQKYQCYKRAWISMLCTVLLTAILAIL